MGWVIRSSRGVTVFPGACSESAIMEKSYDVGLRRLRILTMRPLCGRRAWAAQFDQHLVALHGAFISLGG